MSGWKKTLELDVIETDKPLLLSAAEMKNLYMMIDTTKEEVRVMGKIEELTIMGYGQPAMRLRPKRRGQDNEQ